jgi:hypothetical protein
MRWGLDECSSAYALQQPVRPTLSRASIPIREASPAPTVLTLGVSMEVHMSKGTNTVVSVKILPNDQSSPQGKLADAEVLFEAGAGPLAGLRLIGFAIWERRDGGRNVTFPARAYTVNGERRTFALLRPTEDPAAQNAIRDFILEAYARLPVEA